MKILILGADGMLGHIVKQYFIEQKYTVKGTSLTIGQDYQYDITENIKDLEGYIYDFKPDVVINCIGLLNNVAEENKPLAILLNSYFPHYVDKVCREHHSKFIHVSTDCVFDGLKGKYNENSFTNATSFYGQTKALGEIRNNKSLTLRTSIIGPDINDNGVGLFQWFMNQKEEIYGFDKVLWSGITTLEFAKCMEKAIKNDLTGLRHAVNNDEIDKYSLLNIINDTFNKKINIKKNSDIISNKSLIRQTDFNFHIPNYKRMIEEMKDWINNHKEIYSENQGEIK